MKKKLESVAVYCGHQFGTDPQYARDATELGKLLAANKIRLVFGGGDVGLMGTVAGAAFDNGGVVIGVSTKHVLARQEPAHEHIAVEVVEKVNERKQRMFDLSDAFIILPGGIGTLNELTDIMTMQQIGESKKPIFFLNTHNFWSIFSEVMIHMQDAGFIPRVDEYDITVANTPQELMQKLINHKNFVA